MASQSSVSAEWDAMAGEWDDLAIGYAKSFEKILWEHAGLEQTDLVLDFGCGTGLLTEALRTQVSRVVCIDPSRLMIEQLDNKIKAGEWKNVKTYSVALGDSTTMSEEVAMELQQLEGKIDLIVASSVLSFIPKGDISETMGMLGKFLSKGGQLCHSDWPASEKQKDGFTVDKAKEIYQMAGLEAKTTTELVMKMDDSNEEFPVFFGVAVKP